MTSPWQTATVLSVRDETPTAKTFRLGLDHVVDHRAGQHFVVRLTAPDGYTAARSYSVASPPDAGSAFDLTIERLADGEVSMFLHDVVEPGDELEVRGPIGGYFVWDATSPALLVGGGSGLVPVMAMLRLARMHGFADVHLVVSTRTLADLYYRDELVDCDDSTVLYTRSAPQGASRPPGRVRADDLLPYLRDGATVYVCGSAPFTNTVGDLLVGLDVAPEQIRFERFGPSA